MVMKVVSSPPAGLGCPSFFSQQLLACCFSKLFVLVSPRQCLHVVCPSWKQGLGSFTSPLLAGTGCPSFFSQQPLDCDCLISVVLSCCLSKLEIILTPFVCCHHCVLQVWGGRGNHQFPSNFSPALICCPSSSPQQPPTAVVLFSLPSSHLQEKVISSFMAILPFLLDFFAVMLLA